MTALKPVQNCAFRTQEITVETHSDFVHFAQMRFDDRPEPAKRLEQARLARGFSDARQAADAFGWNYHTYAQHENGTRGIVRAASRYAKAYGVSEAWLLTGDGDGPSGKSAGADHPNAEWVRLLRLSAESFAEQQGTPPFSDKEMESLTGVVRTLFREIPRSDWDLAKRILGVLTTLRKSSTA